MMEEILIRIASLFWPELKMFSGQRRYVGVSEVLTTLYAVPLAAAGFIWLVLVTDLSLIPKVWPLMLFFGVMMVLFRKLGFFMIAEIRAGRYASSDGSMESMVLWGAVFLIGPLALWLAVILSVFDFITRWKTAAPLIDRWSRARNFCQYHTSSVLATLISLEVYQRIGGSIPIVDLSSPSIVFAMTAIITHYALILASWAPYIAYSIWTQARLTSNHSVRPLATFLLIALGLPFLAHPFSILAAGLYQQNGIFTFLFLFTGLVLVALLTRQLSWAAESRRQQSRQIMKLEELSRDILSSPPDASSLPLLLREHIPSMFPSGRVAVWLENNSFLMNYPFDWEPEIEPAWEWLKAHEGPHCFVDRAPLPWQDSLQQHNAVVVYTIPDAKTNLPIGCVYLELFSLAQPWDAKSLANLFPAVQSLSAQVASARQHAEIYQQALAYQRVTQELALAGRIQASFLPDELPPLPGWELAVTLLPARETSGDFFDLIPLENGKVGILIADVADKGVGAALYMALSRTLIRTYAIEFGEDDPQPEVVLFAANGRILNDARAELFVTAFYGILDPGSGTLTYCNAGHPAPLLVRSEGDVDVEFLRATGMPIGIEEDQFWERVTVQILPGDALVLYTDGVPDAQDSEGRFYEEKMLLDVVRSSRGQAAQDIQDLILSDVQEYSSGVQQFDDITLMVIGREKEITKTEQNDPVMSQGTAGGMNP